MPHGLGKGTKPHAYFDDFIRTCDEDELGRAKRLMVEVKERLAEESQSPWQPLDVSDGHFLTSVVISLTWDFGSHITEIVNSQWSLVVAEADNGSFRMRVGCDQVELGIAATWKAFADRAKAAHATSPQTAPYARDGGTLRLQSGYSLAEIKGGGVAASPPSKTISTYRAK